MTNLYDYATRYNLTELFVGKVMEFTALKLDEISASELTLKAEEIKVIEDTIKRNLNHDMVNMTESEVFQFQNLSNAILLNQIKHLAIQLIEEDNPFREIRLTLEMSLIATEICKRMEE